MKLEQIEAAIALGGGSERRARSARLEHRSETHALSCHISIADIPPSVSESILRDVKDAARTISASTTRRSSSSMRVCEVAHGCVIPVGMGSASSEQSVSSGVSQSAH